MKLFPNLTTKEKFYFIHSYYCVPRNINEINTVTNYGKLKFCSSVIKNNIFGTQFHPEKSGIPVYENIKNLKKFNLMKYKTLYGLPQKVIFCKKTLSSSETLLRK